MESTLSWFLQEIPSKKKKEISLKEKLDVIKHRSEGATHAGIGRRDSEILEPAFYLSMHIGRRR